MIRALSNYPPLGENIGSMDVCLLEPAAKKLGSFSGDSVAQGVVPKEFWFKEILLLKAFCSEKVCKCMKCCKPLEAAFIFLLWLSHIVPVILNAVD